jgi:hypothetical protein
MPNQTAFFRAHRIGKLAFQSQRRSMLLQDGLVRESHEIAFVAHMDAQRVVRRENQSFAASPLHYRRKNAKSTQQLYRFPKHSALKILAIGAGAIEALHPHRFHLGVHKPVRPGKFLFQRFQISDEFARASAVLKMLLPIAGAARILAQVNFGIEGLLSALAFIQFAAKGTHVRKNSRAFVI